MFSTSCTGIVPTASVFRILDSRRVWRGEGKVEVPKVPGTHDASDVPEPNVVLVRKRTAPEISSLVGCFLAGSLACSLVTGFLAFLTFLAFVAGGLTPPPQL